MVRKFSYMRITKLWALQELNKRQSENMGEFTQWEVTAIMALPMQCHLLLLLFLFRVSGNPSLHSVKLQMIFKIRDKFLFRLRLINFITFSEHLESQLPFRIKGSRASTSKVSN